jgi:2-polyprenyl-6-methoxyphenol hydroxylase-like FAD-dependent oxidoreductase
MHELGLGERLLQLPHQKVERLFGQFGDTRLQLAELSHLPVRSPFIAMMPQWDFLNFLAEEGRRFPTFKLMMRTEATGLIEEQGEVRGLIASTPQGPIEIRSRLVVGADGRSSILRKESGLEVEELGAPMDALWFRLPRRPTDTEETQGRFDAGRIFVMLNRGDYWQCAFVIPKGSHAKIVAAGLDAFHASVGSLLPFGSERAREIASLDDVKLLSVKVDRLKQWAKPGLLFIGDAAHAMSPVGGVGINLAIQDAVAAANILARPLREDALSFAHLQAVQKRREFPTRFTQRMQVAVHNNIISRALEERQTLKPPALLRWLTRLPVLRRIPARLIVLGIRPEHVAQEIRVGRAAYAT